MTKQLWVHLALLFVTFLYGANYTIAKFALPEYIKPFAFISIRLIAAVLMFWAVDSLNRSEKVLRKDHLLLLVCGIFGAGFNQLFFFKGLSLTSPIHASVMMTMSPIAVILVAALLGREKLTLLKIAGTLIGFLGAVLLLTRQGISLENGTFLGDILILLNGATYAAYLVLVKPLLLKYRSFTVLKWVFLYGMIVAAPVGIPQLMTVEWGTLPPIAWLSVFYVILGVTFTVYLINVWALKFVNASTVGIYIYLQPVFATIIALALNEDVLEMQTVLYAGIIMTGVYLVSKKQKKWEN